MREDVHVTPAVHAAQLLLLNSTTYETFTYTLHSQMYVDTLSSPVSIYKV